MIITIFLLTFVFWFTSLTNNNFTIGKTVLTTSLICETILWILLIDIKYGGFLK